MEQYNFIHKITCVEDDGKYVGQLDGQLSIIIDRHVGPCQPSPNRDLVRLQGLKSNSAVTNYVNELE